MKLYYTPGACSLAQHIALREAGLQFDLEKVDLRSKQTESGRDFKQINPKGYVPTLELDGGGVLTENIAIANYIADKAPSGQLAPKAGTLDRYRLEEWLAFVSTEVHKGFSPLFNPNLPEGMRGIILDRLNSRFDLLEKHLSANGPYLTGEQFTVADGYLFTVMNWTGNLKVDLGKWPTLQAYVERVRNRPKVQEALKAEGLLKAA